jgi:hypothetical protein
VRGLPKQEGIVNRISDFLADVADLVFGGGKRLAIRGIPWGRPRGQFASESDPGT